MAADGPAEPAPRDPVPLDQATTDRMSAQASTDTKPEVVLRKRLYAAGLRYRIHRRVPGTRRTIDIAFVGAKVAVFVDGCFWHGCPEHGRIPKHNRDWWTAKIEGNAARDADTTRRLIEAGWAVVRIWEHEPVESAAAQVAAVVTRRRQRRPPGLGSETSQKVT